MITAYHEQASAAATTGTIALAMLPALSARAARASALSTIAHCTMKQSSATVATDLPTNTLDSQVTTLSWVSDCSV